MTNTARKSTKTARKVRVVEPRVVVRTSRRKSTIEHPAATVEQIVEVAATAVEQHLEGALIDTSTLSDEQILAYL